MSDHIFLETNIPAPYRVPVFDRLSSLLQARGCKLTVAYFSESEGKRYWEKPAIQHSHFFLNRGTLPSIVKRLHTYSAMVARLDEIKPSIIISSGYDIFALESFMWAKLKRVPHVTFTDGTLDKEKDAGAFRRVVRSLVIRRSIACIGASLKSIDLFRHYGAPGEDCFRSCLCARNDLFSPTISEKKHDLLYVAHISHTKMPDLIVDIMNELGRGFSLKIVGDGPLRKGMIGSLQQLPVDFEYAGFVQPVDLPKVFHEARVLLFPTRRDAWGLVANEGCAAGLPVLTTQEAGAAGELIIHGQNGYILPPVARVWAEHIRGLLNKSELYASMSENALKMVAPYTVEAAARGIMDAILHASRHQK